MRTFPAILGILLVLLAPEAFAGKRRLKKAQEAAAPAIEYPALSRADPRKVIPETALSDSLEVDLRASGRKDLVLLAEKGPKETPARLLVYFNEPTGYRLAVNNRSLLESVTGDHWLVELVGIKRGFEVHLKDEEHYEMEARLKFRWESADFRLIGETLSADPQFSFGGRTGRVHCEEDKNLLTGAAIQKVGERKGKKVKLGPEERRTRFLIKDAVAYEASYLEHFCSGD